MNNVKLSLNLLSNTLYEYVFRSPALFINRVETRLGKTVGWKRRFSPTPTTHAVAWVREADNFHTRMYVFNYWSDHYDIPEVPVRILVRDEAGKEVGNVNFTLRPRENKVVEAADVLAELSRPGNFQGTFTFFRTIEGKGFGVPFKLLQEYHGKDYAAPVHEYGTIENMAFRTVQNGVTLSGEDHVDDVCIGVASCNFDSPGEKHDLFISVIAADGHRRTVNAGPMSGGQSVFLSLNALVPGWKRFLGGKPGNLGLEFGHSLGRPLIFHKLRNGVHCLNHATGDKSRTPHIIRANAMAGMGSGPVFVSGVVIDENLTTAISLFSNLGFGRPFEYEGQVFDAEGKPVAQFRKMVRPWETALVDVGALVPAALPRPWVGSVRINIVPDGFVPYSFDANTEFIGKDWRQSVNLSASLLNLPGVFPVKSDQEKRTKNFMRIRRDGIFDGYLLMVHHSSEPSYATSSDTTIRLISQDGQRQKTLKISMPPRSAIFKNVADLFPDYKDVMGDDKVATLHIRDTSAKLHGVHLLKNVKTGVLSGDHYFGG